MNRDALIIAAGGVSRRFGENKLLTDLCGRPVLFRTLQSLAPLFPAGYCILAIPAELRTVYRELVAELPVQYRPVLIDGGDTRFLSIRNALFAVPPDAELVAVHDAARPLVSHDAVLRCLETARIHGAALLAHRVTDTIKTVNPDGIVVSTPPRDTLWAAETPQISRKDLLSEAFEFCFTHGISPTDDAAALEASGIRPHIVENTAPNPKITFPADLELARQLWTVQIGN